MTPEVGAKYLPCLTSDVWWGVHFGWKKKLCKASITHWCGCQAFTLEEYSWTYSTTKVMPTGHTFLHFFSLEEELELEFLYLASLCFPRDVICLWCLWWSSLCLHCLKKLNMGTGSLGNWSNSSAAWSQSSSLCTHIHMLILISFFGTVSVSGSKEKKYISCGDMQ